MFRVVPIVGRRGRMALATTCVGTSGAVYLAAPLYRPAEYTQCTQRDDLQSSTPFASMVSHAPLSLSSLVGDVEQSLSLVLPTMEALLRAARLVKTAAVMAVDYQAYYSQRKHPDSLYSQLYSWAFLDGRDCQENEKQKQLEGSIEQLETDLDRAQHEYVNSKPAKQQSADVDTNSTSLSERTLAKRQQKEEMMHIANELAAAQEELSVLVHESEESSEVGASGIHQRNAHRLLDLCRTNGGVYIKVGQHLANLDLLFPEEYINELSSLFDDAPVSDYEDVCKVVSEELGASPEDLFDNFSKEPIASASLAQVHTAICKESGKKLAIKVQHKGLRETSKGDLFAMSVVVSVADRLFDEFKFGWICEELTPQLPKELDFHNEGCNAEAAGAHLSRTRLDCVVPRVLWKLTTDRVLAMDFEEGFRATDVQRIEEAGLCKRDVAKLISSVFNSQIFEDSPGFLHCDPHPANVLLREHPTKKGKPQIVLVDHGLYKTLGKDFQEAYARLWKGIVMANIPEIKLSCEQLGVYEMYPLLAAMLTARPFDEVVERSQTRSLDALPTGNGDEAVIRGYAQRYIKDIVRLLDVVPRQMLLVFKMNDCLRSIDTKLGSPVNNLVVAGRYASKRVYESESSGGVLRLLRSWLSYVHVLLRVNAYELFTTLR